MNISDSLERLVTMIDDDLGAVAELPEGESAQIIRVTNNGEVALRSLEGQHPFDALLGFVAPSDWDVFGVIAPGWGTSPKGRIRIRAIYLMDRAGGVASVLRFADGEVTMTGAMPGRVADCVARVLDQPTLPESDEALLAFWWDRVLKRLAKRTTAVANVGAIADIIGEMRPESWADERWQTIRDGGNEVMDGSMAAWMDDGMFARAMLAEMVEPTDLLPAAKRNCTPEVWTALLHHFAEAALEGE